MEEVSITCKIFTFFFDFKPRSNTRSAQIINIIQLRSRVDCNVTIYHRKVMQKCIAEMGPKCTDN